MNKRKLYGTLIAVIAFAILVVGATFAWLTYEFNATNGLYNTATSCFSVQNVSGANINETLRYVTNPTSGAHTSVSMLLSNNCNISANGVITLNVENTTSAALYSTVADHCENFYTEETLYNYTDSQTCNNNNGKWVTGKPALKYAIYDTYNPTTSTIPLKVGYITQSGENEIYSATLRREVSIYNIYIWLDGELADETHSGASFQGTINAVAVQNVEHINSPELVSGLIPVKLSTSGDTVTTVATTDPEWYDYDNKKWANAVLVKASGVKTRAQNSVVGTVIDQSDILAYYVWIPRYSYKVWAYDGNDSAGDPYEIPIKFVSAPVKDMAEAKGQWYTHPAFTFGNTELAGIWVGKFETHHTSYQTNSASSLGCSSTSCDSTKYNGLRILPNVRSLTNNTVSSFFFASRAMEKSGNDFGINPSTTDSHMMKNSEWGAVAYLSHSKYGINDEIRINNTYNIVYNGSTRTYLTGCGAGTPNEASEAACDIQYGTISNGSYPQSTTGNVTGVFDMSGGTSEYVMGTYNNDNNYGNSSNSAFNSSTNPLPDTKYYDNYSNPPFTGNSNTLTQCTFATCGGHALYETRSWHNDFGIFIISSRPWLIRGGKYDHTTNAGIFYANNNTGAIDSVYSMRLVLLAE